MAKPKGGRRPGAGRPKGSQNASTIRRAEDAALERQAFRDYIAAHAEAMHAAQIANAKGISYMVVRDKKTGKFLRVAEAVAGKLNAEEEVIEIWEKDPSIQAYTDLMNRFLDKPKEQPQDVAVKGEFFVRWAE